MRYRCSKPTDISYKYYGLKGIKVCDEWDNDYQSFYDWAVNNGYKEGLEIDRIDTYGDYCPTNCRWTTRKEQMNNTTFNRSITINNITLTISEWSSLFNISYDLFWDRLKAGWDAVSALTAPVYYQYNMKGKFNDGEELFRAAIQH